MSGSQEWAGREKQELAKKEGKTPLGRYPVPVVDIFETGEALTVSLEMPGVERKNVSVHLEDDVLRIDGQIDFSKYEGLDPVYTEYNIGHYSRSFAISEKVDRDRISAQLDDGVLTLTLPKAKEAMSRRIAIT
jgi:HSP20 family molecular chaperone IbpA